MVAILTLFLFLGGLVRSQADVNISDYIYWKKEDINQYHQFFPSRALEEERMTNEAAAVAVQRMTGSVSDDCSRIVAFQYRELLTAQHLMAGTEAEGCVNGISHFLDKAIQDQVDKFMDCIADAQIKLVRLSNNWTRTKTTYLAAYQRALSGIDACARAYPNKGSIDRLRSCVESMNKIYFVVANSTQASIFPSPSMGYFQNTVIQCASTAAKAVADKGSQFLKMLVDCANLSGTVDTTGYAEELSHWKGYNGTLSEQIINSQTSHYYQMFAVELEMKNYYKLQKEALEQYVIESRGLDFYLKKIYNNLSDYYNTVTAASLDNPGESQCAASARTSLDKTVNTSAALSLSCDEHIIDDTKRRMADVYESFVSLNVELTSIGNVALLNCFSEGSIFAPDIIEKCFKLTYAEFQINATDALDAIAKETLILSDYISTFYSNTQLPCGNYSLKRAVLAAENVLYDLKRCLYKFSGIAYEVTTPVYTTASPRINTTTEFATYSTTACWCPCTPSTQAYPYNQTTEGYSHNTTTEAYLYNTTTEEYPYNRTTEGYPYKTTTEAYPYNRTTEGYPYNTTTEASPYNITTERYQYNTTTEPYPYNRTTERYPYNKTTEASSYNITTERYPYNTTTQAYPYNRTTELYPYNTTTEASPYNITTERYPFNTTTETYPYSSSTRGYPNSTSTYRTTVLPSKTTKARASTARPTRGSKRHSKVGARSFYA